MAIKLNRAEHIALSNIQRGSLGGLTEQILQKLVLHQLVTAHIKPGERSCTYTIAAAGTKYLKDNPALPLVRLTEKEALLIYRALGDESYECMNPLRYQRDNSPSANKLIALRILVERINADGKITGYVLSDDGRQIFETTPTGQAYLERRKLVERREALDKRFAQIKAHHTKTGAAYMRAKAAFMRRNGQPDYADTLEADADKRQEVDDLCQRFNLQPTNIDLGGGHRDDQKTIYVGKCEVWSPNPKYHNDGIGWWFVKANHSIYTSRSSDGNVSEAEQYVADIQKAIQIAKALNEDHRKGLALEKQKATKMLMEDSDAQVQS